MAAGHRRVVVPAANAPEASLVPGAVVVAADSLAQAARAYGADIDVPDVVAVASDHLEVTRTAPDADLGDVLGQDEARMALEVAAAGGHHLLMVGPPGSGKTMLAARLPGLLPDLTEAEAVEVTAVHSVAGTFDLLAAANRTGNFAGFAANRFATVYAIFPHGLPRWQLYSTSATAAPRRPTGGRGILAITNVGPRFDGVPSSVISTPTSLT